MWEVDLILIAVAEREKRSDRRLAALMCQLRNIHRGPKQQPATVEQMFPDLFDKPKPKRQPENIGHHLAMIAPMGIRIVGKFERKKSWQ